MTRHVLSEARDIFLKTTGNKGVNCWRMYVESLRSYVRSLSDADQETLYQSAMEEMSGATKKDPRMDVWFFSHGSFEIFQAFLDYNSLCQDFAHFLSQANDRRWPFIDRVTRMIPRKVRERDILAQYAKFYSWELEGKKYKLFFLTRSSHFLHVHLVPRPHLEDGSLPYLVQKYQRESAPDVLREQVVYYSLPSVQSQLTSKSRSALETEVGELIEIQIDEPQWDIPDRWYDIECIEDVTLDEMRSGKWLRFSVEPQPTLSAHTASWLYSLPVPGVSEVVAKYLPEVSKLYDRLCVTENGRLPIGIKVHSLKSNAFNPSMFIISPFRLERANSCAILPPVGNMSAVQEVFTIIEKGMGFSVLDNPDFQIQVCCPGELSLENAALLGACFYLGSDRLRRYARRDFTTSHDDATGGRLIVYGAGTMNPDFTWWGKSKSGELSVGLIPSEIRNRTDVLTCRTLTDIDNVNFVATLLMHAQYGGFWEELGKQFIAEITSLLEQNLLSGILHVAWVYGEEAQSKDASELPEDPDGSLFFHMFAELMDYAFAEFKRIEAARKIGDHEASHSGILFQVKDLLRTYRSEFEVRSPTHKSGGDDDPWASARI